MPLFRYEAVSTSGQRSDGTLEAADRGEAVRKLARKGLQPFALKPEGEFKASPKANGKTNKTEKSDSKVLAPPGKSTKADKVAAAGIPVRLSKAQIIQFTEELCDLLTAGLQLESALHAMENRSASVLRVASSFLRERVRDGVPFSLALQQVSPSFGELYCNLVAAGEASGSLSSILNRQARYLNQMETLRGKVTSALIYPAFIVASGLALGLVFIGYLLPKLTVLIKNTNGKIPKIAEVLLGFSDLIKHWWWAIAIFIVLVVVAIKVLLQDKTRLAWWHRMQLSLPVYGPVLRTRFEVQFLETLGNLLHNGLPLHRALELVRKATTNLFLRERLATVEAQVGDGGSLSRALEKADVARPLVVDMVRVGEQTGEMADALEKAANRFDRQLSKTIEQATALIQPVIMVVMAGMVGTMAYMMINVVYGTLENLRR
jgi:type II secretory pathway component PulF